MEIKEKQLILLTFKSIYIESLNKYFTLDGKREINDSVYRKPIFLSEDNGLSKEELEYLSNKTN